MSELFLLDFSVLIALSFGDHMHHERAVQWFETEVEKFATCPITQSALVRFTLRQPGATAKTAQELLSRITGRESHVFWPDDLTCTHLPWRLITGHRQVTDAYLCSLADAHGGRLATLNESLAVVFASSFLLPA